jgi:hypothetical protein
MSLTFKLDLWKYPPIHKIQLMKLNTLLEFHNVSKGHPNSVFRVHDYAKQARSKNKSVSPKLR